MPKAEEPGISVAEMSWPVPDMRDDTGLLQSLHYGNTQL